ncbi:MAG: fasciclin domain-containing protein, partial [Prevotella sp.]|nr:fasciclin domain-containing protein [Prevotella sp.]
MTFKFGLTSLLLTALLLTSCKEWDEHYDAGSAVEGSATASIWENITANANLSQFATLVQKAGYDELLKSTQTLTVWAPLNGTFDYDALMAESNETLLKEFVQNHIARNNYPASGLVDQKISMLNLKHLSFEGNGNYTMDGIAVAQPNVASLNGVIHTINGKLQFRSNIFESLNNKDFPIDSVSDYVHRYDQMVFNESKSTKGPVVDGRITYLDSIFDEYNMICQRYAYIDREDSNYSMIVPSNEAWTKAMSYIKQCYNFVNFTYCDNPDSIKNVNYKKGEVSFNPSPEYWKDSISYGMMLQGLFYNNNLYDNKKLK